MAAKAVRDIPEVVTIPHKGTARGRYRNNFGYIPGYIGIVNN